MRPFELLVMKRPGIPSRWGEGNFGFLDQML